MSILIAIDRATAYVKSSVSGNNVMIDGTDFPTDAAWRKAILDEVKDLLSSVTISGVSE